MPGIDVEVPDQKRQELGLPDGPLVVVSSYAIGYDSNRIGLWFARASESFSGQRWPATVLKKDAEAWQDAVRSARERGERL